MNISINKYKLYFVLLFLLLGCYLVPKFWRAHTYKQTIGIVDHFTYVEGHGRYRSNTYFPMVNFVVGTDTISFYGSQFEHDEIYMNSKVPVLYNPKNPNDAYVYTALGFWDPPLIYVIPIFVVISAVLLSVDGLPKMINFRW